jgi:hypothetical protein
MATALRDKQFGGPGKTVEVDETYITRRKYSRGRKTAQMSMIILGIYCREDKEGMYWLIPSKRIVDIWPLMKKYIQ